MTSNHRLTRRAALGTALAAGTMTTMTGITSGSATGQPQTPKDLGQRTANGHLYEIRHGNQRAVIAGVAATLLSWRVEGNEMLLTHSPHEMGEGYQGKTILPWANRIDKGKYTFDDEQLQVPINEPERNAALHGLMSFSEWTLHAWTPNRVVLGYSLAPHYGYPFQMEFRAQYTIDEYGIHNTLWAHNVGRTRAPYTTANHSYIAAGAGTIDSIEFRLPASTYYLTNDRLIPTGTAAVDGTQYDFRTRREIGATKMDTAFTDLLRASDGSAITQLVGPNGHTVEMWVDETYTHLQVFTDDDPSDHPARSGITIEPMIGAPDCFNSGDGLVILAGDETLESHWGYRVV